MSWLHSISILKFRGKPHLFFCIRGWLSHGRMSTVCLRLDLGNIQEIRDDLVGFVVDVFLGDDDLEFC